MATRFAFNRPATRIGARPLHQVAPEQAVRAARIIGRWVTEHAPDAFDKAGSAVRLLAYVALLGAIGGAILATIAMSIAAR
jgi:hypothetical protein